MHRMEEMQPPLGVYHPSQDPPLVVQPNKDHESTTSSVRSHRIPDYSVPPLATHTYKTPPNESLLPGQAVQVLVTTTHDQSDQQTSLLKTIKRVTSVVEQKVILSGTHAEHTIIQSNKLFQEFIKSQNKRDLDPALMSIPTIMGEDSSQCLDWITRIKNVCVQSRHSLHQELINKVGIVVQNYLTSLDATLSKKEMEEKSLQHFSDIPTTTQAIQKLKSLRQGESESILAHNQRYKILAERVEGRPINEVQSAVAMEMYLRTIIAPLRKNIKDNLFWNSKHAPKNLSEAMKKSEELYIKHLYSSISELDEDCGNRKQNKVIINKVNYGERRDFRRQRYDDKREKPNYRGGFGKRDSWNDSHNQRSKESSESGKKSNYHSSFGKRDGWNDTYNQRSKEPNCSKISNKSISSWERHITWTEQVKNDKNSDNLNNRTSLLTSSDSNATLLKGSYTQIMVNPMELSDHEFTNWMEKLMEARRNRQDRRECPYRAYRKPYNATEQEPRHLQLRNKLRPAQDLDVQNIMTAYNCSYDDVVEAVDLYNLDVEDSQTA